MIKEFESLMDGLAKHIDFIFKQDIKPNNIIFDIINKKLILDFNHDDFINIFGDSFNMSEIQQYGDSFVLERMTGVLGISITLKVNVFSFEVMEKKLSKIYTN